MRNVQMIRMEQDLISIPVEKAVYCENCETVSSSAERRCGLCGSEQIIRLAPLIPPKAVGPGPGSSLCHSRIESRPGGVRFDTRRFSDG